MNEQIPCVEPERLVAYLYGDADPADQADVAAHLATCTRCAEALGGLSDTRRALAAWMPPEVSIGWRVPDDGPRAVPAAVRESGQVGVPAAAWWRQPLPAWAQAVAAVLIFAAGLAAGTRSQNASPGTPAPASPDWGPVMARMQERLEIVEQSTRAHETALAAATQPGDVSPALMRWTRNEIAASEDRMRGTLFLGLINLKREENQVQQSLSDNVDRLNYQVQYVTQLVGQE